MKALLSICCLFFASCTAIHHPTAGKFFSLAGDTSKLKANAEGFGFDSNNNSTAFGKAADTTEKIAKGIAVKAVAGDAISAAENVIE